VPQLLRSAIRSTHAPAHRVFGLWHRDVHAAPLQTRPGGHTVPQAPQFEGSVSVSTQVPAQAMAFEGQVHAPLTHWKPAAQRRPHPPQFRGSVEVSTQPPPQGVSPDAHPFEVQAPT
jgi:hypothetical protein